MCTYNKLNKHTIVVTFVKLITVFILILDC